MAVEVALRRRDGSVRAVAVVDDADLPLVSGRRWSLNGVGYVQHGATGVYLHRLIMGCTPGDGVRVDHRDGDALNNRRSNLRRTDASGNAHNRSAPGHGSSHHVGVSWCSWTNRWRATVKLNGRYVHIGRYPTEDAAARAADEWRSANCPTYTSADRPAV